MNQQLIKLIELCLIDGVISDKERSVIFKKSEELGISKDECEIILEGMIQKHSKKNTSQPQKKKGFFGSIMDEVKKNIDVDSITDKVKSIQEEYEKKVEEVINQNQPKTTSSSKTSKPKSTTPKKVSKPKPTSSKPKKTNTKSSTIESKKSKSKEDEQRLREIEKESLIILPFFHEMKKNGKLYKFIFRKLVFTKDYVYDFWWKNFERSYYDLVCSTIPYDISLSHLEENFEISKTSYIQLWTSGPTLPYPPSKLSINDINKLKNIEYDFLKYDINGISIDKTPIIEFNYSNDFEMGKRFWSDSLDFDGIPSHSYNIYLKLINKNKKNILINDLIKNKEKIEIWTLQNDDGHKNYNFIFRNIEVLINKGYKYFKSLESILIENKKELESYKYTEQELILDNNIYFNILKNNQSKINEIDREYVQKFIKLNNYLKQKSSNLSTILEKTISNLENEPKETILEREQEINFFKGLVYSYNLMVNHSIVMVTSLVEDDTITFYEIYEVFDKMNVFNTNWENEVNDKLSEINESLHDLNFSIIGLMSQMRGMERNIVNGLQSINTSIGSLENSVNKQLSETNSRLKYDNLTSYYKKSTLPGVMDWFDGP
tara:strand:+ start:308 stop:2119 length:1812 start_codon:yes stop_codon:yes gene_type:complete